jgi:hypothetical protein
VEAKQPFPSAPQPLGSTMAVSLWATAVARGRRERGGGDGLEQAVSDV